MTPKEKAQGLVNKFSHANGGHFYQDSPIEDLEAAKECALVAVDEIIKAKPTAEYGDPFIGNHSYDNVSYWEQVKQEIGKL